MNRKKKSLYAALFMILGLITTIVLAACSPAAGEPDMFRVGFTPVLPSNRKHLRVL